MLSHTPKSGTLKNEIVIKAQEELFGQFIIFNPFYIKAKKEKLTEEDILEPVGQLIQKIKENGGDIDCINKHQETFVLLAIENNCSRILELLIEAKADFSRESRSKSFIVKDSYLNIAIEENLVECVRVLLQARANVETMDYYYFRKNSLMIAVENGHDKCVDLLLNAKANPNSERSHGNRLRCLQQC
jgi:ankyrin repeat protein